MEFLSVPIWQKIFWSKISYIGVASAATLWFILVMKFLKYEEYISTKYIGVLMLWPLIIMVMAFTNEWHGLLWTNITPISNLPGDLLIYDHGPLFWAINLYSFFMILIGVFILTRKVSQADAEKKAKIFILIFSGLVPIIFNFLYVSNLIPVQGLDLTPLGLSIAVILALIGIFKFNLLDVRQIATKRIFKSMKTGILVFDDKNLLVEVNPAASMIGITPDMLGKDLDEVLDQDSLKSIYHEKVAEKELFLSKPINKWIQARITPIYNSENQEIGTLLTVNNISDLKKSEERLKKRDVLLEGVANMTKMLITQPDLDKAMDGALSIIGNATGIDRTYIFQNSQNDDGDVFMNQKFEWTNGKVSAEINNPKLQNLSYKMIKPDMFEILSKNQPYYGIADELEGKIKEILEDEEIISILLVPLFVKKLFWGFIGFDNCTDQRRWKNYELTILKAAADSIASAIERNQAEKALAISEKKSKTIISAIPDMMFIMDQEGRYLDFAYESEELLALDPQKLIGKNLSDIGLTTEEFNLANIKLKKAFGEGTRESFEYKLDLPIGTHYFEARMMKLSEEEVLCIVRDITEQVNAQTLINESLKEKEVLLREIHHRVKNNMQIIHSLLNLQKRTVSQSETKEVLKESQGRVMAMAMIHEKLYQSSNLTKINFKIYVEKLVRQLFSLYNVNEQQIKIFFKMENIEMNVDTAIPCGLIINEIITNSLKYAFPMGEGILKLELKKTNNDFFMVIEDDGIGLPDDISLEKTSTLGLQLVNSLISQIDGSITLEEGLGTRYIIKFREVKYNERL
jgi:PAS domain S-box-containing protein